MEKETGIEELQEKLRKLEEKQEILRVLRKKKIEFDDEFRRELKKQRQKKETSIEELYQQISDMKCKEDK